MACAQHGRSGRTDAFAMTATLAAFNESEPWLEELRAYLAGNKAEARAMINEYNAAAAPERRIALIESHATYLLWVDCSKLTHDTALLCEHLKRNHQVMSPKVPSMAATGMISFASTWLAREAPCKKDSIVCSPGCMIFRQSNTLIIDCDIAHSRIKTAGFVGFHKIWKGRFRMVTAVRDVLAIL